MSRPVALFSSVLCLLWSGCMCDGTRVDHVQDPCVLYPQTCVNPDHDAGFIENTCANQGSVTGRVCATDQQTWVNGATVSIVATDCNGAAVTLTSTSAADGTFTLPNVPPGDWVVHAALGSFTQDTAVTVRANAATAIPDNQLCVSQHTVQIAVITGSGDKIENLLDTLQLHYTRYGGDSSTWTTQAEPFLSDLAAMQKYDLILVDCAAAKASGNIINFGSANALITSNLHQYVMQGGSVYSSDWALLFTLSAAPSNFQYATQSGTPPAHPLDTAQLMGYAPQTVTATVTDPGLAQFLNKGSMTIAFPKASGANSLHWGLMAAAPGAEVLVSADSAVTCSTSACTATGATMHSVPLAVRARLLPAGSKGGNVVYTSFHNVDQTGSDVAQVLKYLVLNL
jgi:hypothetical protein